MESVHAVIAALDRRIVQATVNTLLIAGEDIRTKGKNVTSNWKHKPDFSAAPTIEARYIEVLITPTGSNAKIYGYVDRGTGRWGKNHTPYLIVPKDPAGYLIFQTGYSAKTAPIARGNVGTGARFGDWKRKKSVLHPGIESRKFSEDFADNLSPALDVRVTAAIKQVV